jgi:hypothetical protein
VEYNLRSFHKKDIEGYDKQVVGQKKERRLIQVQRPQLVETPLLFYLEQEPSTLLQTW